jgi:hypothetical protein
MAAKMADARIPRCITGTPASDNWREVVIGAPCVAATFDLPALRAVRGESRRVQRSCGCVD